MTTAVEIKNKAEAEKIIETHVESPIGTCVQCMRVENLAVYVPCYYRIAAARFIAKSGSTPV